MKVFASNVVSLAVLLHSVLGGSSSNHKRSTKTPSPHGTVFKINGKTQYFAGTNAWWLGHLDSDADVERACSQIASSGLKVTRVWGQGNSNTGTDQDIYYQLLNNVTNTISINYNKTTGIPRLDSAVKHAEKHNLKLVLPMLNNWDDLGGINIYCYYFGCNATTFWTHKAAQKAYRNYVSFIVNRYKNSPAIFAWELCNEPHCDGCDTSVLTNWANETSAFVKSLDPHHMVALGDEGWFCGGGDGSWVYSCSQGIDFETNLKIKTLDYGTFHLYTDSWGYNYSFGLEWIRQHAALATKHNKPIVLEEYSIPDDKYNKRNRTSMMERYQATILASNIAYDSNWGFGTVFADGENFFEYDDYTSYYGTPYYQKTVINHAKAMSAKKV